MGNSLRCCLACVLPCGALDLIRIVHINGYFEELAGPITAEEVLKDNPNHVLTKSSSQGMARRILILSPGSELKRGGIYFLIPESSLPEKKKIPNLPKKSTIKCSGDHSTEAADCGRKLREVKSEKKSSSSRRDRQRGRVGVWRPHLESISED